MRFLGPFRLLALQPSGARFGHEERRVELRRAGLGPSSRQRLHVGDRGQSGNAKSVCAPRRGRLAAWVHQGPSLLRLTHVQLASDSAGSSALVLRA